VIARRWALISLIAIALVLVAGRTVASLHADRLWFDAMGALSVWRTRTMYTAVMMITSAVIAGLVVFFNLYAVRRSIVSLVFQRRVANIEIGEEVPPHYLMGAVVGLSVLFGALLALPADTWLSAALAMRGVPFRESDPYFAADLGFFVYWLPFESTLYVWSLITLLVATALVIFLYALTPGLKRERGTLHVSGYVRRHLTVIACLLLLLLAWSYRLDGFQLLLDGSGADGEFLALDHLVGLRAATVLAFVTIGAAFVVLWTGWNGQLPLVLAAVSVVLVASFVIKQIVPAFELRGGGSIDAATRERPYLEIRRLYTQRAFAVDEIVTADAAAGFRTWEEAARGVPAWDAPVLARALAWSHGRAVVDAAAGLQMTPAGLVATVVVPPADTGGAVTDDNPWILARARATRTDGRGGAVRVDRRGVPVADDDALPTVLVHPGARAYRLVIDSLGVVAAPGLQRFSSRLAQAWSLQNFRLLFDESAASASIVTHRDLRDRIRTLAPFFAQGSTVSPAVVSDTLYWIVDLYSTSESYPFSAPVTVAGAPRKYFQHAGTAIVTATTGRVRLVSATELDPVAQSWLAFFPDLFTPAAELPRDLLEALPPAGDGAYAQASVFAWYGTRRETTSGGKLPWQYGGDTLVPANAPVDVVLPASEPAASWVQPVLDATEHVRGLVVATGGASRVTLWLPSAAPTARWTQLVDRIQQHTDTTPTPRDTRWVRGAVRAFPVAGSVAFAQTTYAWRSTTPPTIARVTVLAGDSVVSGQTLGHAVGVSIGTDAVGPMNPVDFRARVEALHAAMRAAIRRGDWASFGEAFDSLGAMLEAPRALAPPPDPR
jgi:uncharacterized membrane protein (UPF0182 family)